MDQKTNVRYMFCFLGNREEEMDVMMGLLMRLVVICSRWGPVQEECGVTLKPRISLLVPSRGVPDSSEIEYECLRLLLV